MKRIVSSLCLLSLVVSLFAQPVFEPVTVNASPEARELLSFLYQIRGKKILSGHHNYIKEPDQYTQRVTEITGKTPAVWGCDFGYHGWEYRPQLVREAIRQHQKGSIITLMWHSQRPFEGEPADFKSQVQGPFSAEQWTELVTPGTTMNRNWQAQVDTVAFYLKQLQQAHIPVLWRPYHEMNGIWFWWGDRKGENGYKKLWVMLYDRLVNVHKLTNLIWVWNANAPRLLPNDEAWAYADFYPGNQYVDVLAADVYHNDYKQSHHDQLLELGQGKAIALGEIGEVPTPEILDQQPQWCWFMIWTNWVETHNTPEQVNALYNYSRTLTLDQLIKLKPASVKQNK